MHASSSEVFFVDMNSDDSLKHLRHTAAHLLAKAVLTLYPGAQNAIGPAINNGFYQDFDLGDVKLSESDLPVIEKKMDEIRKGWEHIVIRSVSVEEAKKLFSNNPYKLELIDEISKRKEKITVNDPGDFLDLCKGGHCEHPNTQLAHIKLLSLAGAYWRGNEKNKMLTRIYGTAFKTKEELNAYLFSLAEAKKRDHRKLGKELDLFVFSDLVGAGLPLFTPKGTIIRDQLVLYSEELQKSFGYQKVWIPHITKADLYKKSGHWDKFGNELFLVESQETKDQFVLKPMNCPHHTQIYASSTRSYKDLPIRYMETTVQYRDEKAGEMLGLSRVRSITIDDAHVFVRPDQVESEFENIMTMIKKMYQTLGMKFTARLSFRNDEDKFLGKKDDWQSAQETIVRVADSLQLDYTIALGEAAFYGPKIDIMVVDALGRQWQCATEQLDFVQPVRFGLTYTDEHGKQQTPFMIHKALLGSIERFLSVYIEHTGGKFPLWLSPLQAVILPIADRHKEKAFGVVENLVKAGIRAEVDERPERLQAKIRHHTLQKVPYMGIIGDKEADNKGSIAVSLRTRDGEDLGQVGLEIFIKQLREKIDKKVS